MCSRGCRNIERSILVFPYPLNWVWFRDYLTFLAVRLNGMNDGKDIYILRRTKPLGESNNHIIERKRDCDRIIRIQMILLWCQLMQQSENQQDSETKIHQIKQVLRRFYWSIRCKIRMHLNLQRADERKMEENGS